MSVRDQGGLVGKVLVVWLLILAVVVLGVLDLASITTTRFHIADVAAQAAQDGANATVPANQAPQKVACDAARASLTAADPAVKMTSCLLDPSTHKLTITVRKTAHTIAAGRIGFLQKFTRVEDTETAGPSAL